MSKQDIVAAVAAVVADEEAFVVVAEILFGFAGDEIVPEEIEAMVWEALSF